MFASGCARRCLYGRRRGPRYAPSLRARFLAARRYCGGLGYILADEGGVRGHAPSSSARHYRAAYRCRRSELDHACGRGLADTTSAASPRASWLRVGLTLASWHRPGLIAAARAELGIGLAGARRRRRTPRMLAVAAPVLPERESRPLGWAGGVVRGRPSLSTYVCHPFPHLIVLPHSIHPASTSARRTNANSTSLFKPSFPISVVHTYRRAMRQSTASAHSRSGGTPTRECPPPRAPVSSRTDTL
ncbi:hypothetical protein C8J57DRAFT_277472 [Mycena rebaudengoi]|nr:hypothetical protein C8J57DRAFT_277472 [Mycena rebaudengoi]